MRALIAIVLAGFLTGIGLADPLADLRNRHGSRKAWLEALEAHDLEPCPMLAFHERFRFETLWFGVRQYEYVDYRHDRPVETAITLDQGWPGPLHPGLRYCEVDPTLELRVVDGTLGVVSVSLPRPPRPYRGYRLLRPPDPPPPDVLVGTIDEAGRMVPAIRLPSIQDGWTYACDPFDGAVVRMNAGSAFPPPAGFSPDAVTIPASQVEVRDSAGRPLAGALVDLGRLPGQPEPILVVEHQGVRLAIAASGARERAFGCDLRHQPGIPVGVDRIDFPRWVFRPDAVRIVGSALQFAPRQVAGVR